VALEKGAPVELLPQPVVRCLIYGYQFRLVFGLSVFQKRCL